MQTRSRNVCLYAAILSASCIVALNPVTYGIVLTDANWWERTLSRLSILFFDGYLLVFAVLALYYVRKGNGKILPLLYALIVLFLPSLFCAELALNYYKDKTATQERLSETRYDNYAADRELGWVPRGNHVFVNTFPTGPTIRFPLDEEGRRPIPTSANPEHRIFVFGDSFLFGIGVDNESTALSLLKKKLGPRVDIYDYAVSGYGLEQMYARFLRVSKRLRAGDIVLFAPYSDDLTRNLISHRDPCILYFRTVMSEQYETFPVIEDGRVSVRNLDHACSVIRDLLIGQSPLAFGKVYRAFEAWWNQPAYVSNADAIFGAAKKITEATEGAVFKALFVASAVECMNGHHNFDVSLLSTPHDTMIRFCPADREASEGLQHSFDYHWSAKGNEWAADALATMLKESMPFLGRAGQDLTERSSGDTRTH